MIRRSLALAVLACIPAISFADSGDQAALDQCIAYWGKSSPFRKGTAPQGVISTGVKVFGIGSSSSGDDTVTAKPRLVLVRPAVNVMGRSTIRLANPHGWYCFRSNVTVMGKLEIDAQCHAHLATAREEGTAVGAADESSKGVAVFGALRVNRFGCDEARGKG
ncbi:MAG TPA: hypothetical protein VN782_14475 [Usitatibacter sp.]|nr:hypothetical protein [Usitatibacter sp.]